MRQLAAAIVLVVATWSSGAAQEVVPPPKGLLSVGTAPQQSALMFAALFTILLADEWGGAGSNVGKGFRLIPALALGALLAVASCVANPPLPRAPDRPYPEPADICRPPYHG